jgi:ABC-2 type transport system permease protein
MRKIWTIAAREYKAAVRTKAFVISMVMMPVLMAGSIGLQILFKKLDDTKDKRYAVIDRTAGGHLATALQAAADQYNQHLLFDPETKAQIAPKVVLEIVPPNDETPESLARQRFDLSKRVEHDEIEGILEIGPNVFDVRDGPPQSADKVDDAAAIRFQAKKPTQRVFMHWAQQALNNAIQAKRFKDEKIDASKISSLQQQAPVKYKALTKQTADGRFEDATEGAQVANFLLPAALIGLMFAVIMTGATPAMQGIVEEKSQRIAEVLLGSVSPFQLMAGKLTGLIGVSMTMAAVYLVGGYAVAERYGVAEMLSPALLAWFLVFLVLALLIFGSLFIAVGAAAGDIKDTQTLLMPIMIIACLPFFALGPILQDPNGRIAVICSYFPFAAPMLLVARQSVPPGVPISQMFTGIVLVLLTTLFCVWAAGRIFRVGILMQGKGPKMTDLVRWVMRG